MANLDQIYDIDHRVDGIANHQDGILVCLAGPGTGKTSSFLERIKILSAKLGVDIDKICYLTFIREISKSFAADFEEGEERSTYGPFSPQISTLHSFACRLIRNQGFRRGFNGPLYFTSIADTKNDESKVFLSDLLLLVKTNQLKSIANLRKVLAKVKKTWRDNIDPDSLGDTVPTVLPSCLKLSLTYRLIDWDQAVPFAHSLFQSLDEPPRWIACIENFLVDEYQDFNQAEQVFINTLATTVKSMVIVGDDDQSLYSGRGGLPDGLRELYNSNNVDKISLVRCYRCKSEILKVANTFLATMRPDPRPMSPKFHGGQIVCQGFKSRKAEIEYLADFLKTCVAALPERPTRKDGIVCLFPIRKALESYMTCLSEAGVPCYSRKTPSHPERTWLEQALALVCNPEQRFVERLLLEDFNDIKPRHKRAMVDLVLERDISPVEAMDILVSEKQLSGAAVSAVQAFSNLCRALSS
ncbi:MAG: UvrD-helicase domain-containing protein, partial [Planctomycetota bacterium]